MPIPGECPDVDLKASLDGIHVLFHCLKQLEHHRPRHHRYLYHQELLSSPSRCHRRMGRRTGQDRKDQVFPTRVRHHARKVDKIGHGNAFNLYTKLQVYLELVRRCIR